MMKPARHQTSRVLIAVILLNIAVLSATSADSGNAKADMQEATKMVGVADWTWAKDDFASIMTIAVTITNHSRWDIKDIQLRAEHTSASGTVIDSNERTIYDIVPAGATRKFTQNMGFMHSQSQKSSLQIRRFKLDGQPKYTLEQIEARRQQLAQARTNALEQAKAAVLKKKQDQAAAVLKHHQTLAEKGDPYGQLKMGQRYASGDGVEKDLQKARALLARSAAQKNAEAAQALKNLAGSPP